MTKRHNPSGMDSVSRPIYERGSVARFTKEETEHWHTWSCGCQSAVHRKYFDVIPCNEDCLTYRALLGEETEDPGAICNCDGTETM